MKIPEIPDNFMNSVTQSCATPDWIVFVFVLNLVGVEQNCFFCFGGGQGGQVCREGGVKKTNFENLGIFLVGVGGR